MSDLSANKQTGVAQDKSVPDLASEQAAELDQQGALSSASSVASQPESPEAPQQDAAVLGTAEDKPVLTRRAWYSRT